MVPPVSHRISRVPHYSGYFTGKKQRFVYGIVTLCDQTFQNVPLRRYNTLTVKSYYPDDAETPPVWAAPLSLAATRGITRLFSFPAGTEMFQFPAFASVIKRMV